MKRNSRVLAVAFGVVLLVAVFGGFFSANTKEEWYILIRPGLSPPDHIFSIVWPVLYALIALSFYFAWNSAKPKEREIVDWGYGLNIFFNAMWGFLFFGLKNPLAGFVDIVLILTSLIWIMQITWKIEKEAFWLLVPYLLWIIFAMVLNLQAIYNLGI
ncbi:MAG: TspO/MBR family protein [Nanoarchaeota archaeon]